MFELFAQNAALIAVALVVLMIFAVVITIARNYHNVPPNQVAVVSGRQRKVIEGSGAAKRGYRVVRGGGFLLWPVLERLDMMSLNVMAFPVEATGVPDISLRGNRA